MSPTRSSISFGKTYTTTQEHIVMQWILDVAPCANRSPGCVWRSIWMTCLRTNENGQKGFMGSVVQGQDTCNEVQACHISMFNMRHIYSALCGVRRTKRSPVQQVRNLELVRMMHRAGTDPRRALGLSPTQPCCQERWRISQCSWSMGCVHVASQSAPVSISSPLSSLRLFSFLL